MDKTLDLHDDASRYVLGQMPAAERRRFETQLEQSTELRALVRGLEEGVVALTLATPRREPPARVWQAIDQAVAAEASRKTAFFSPRTLWLWSGWAAAACLLGWLLLAPARLHQAGPAASAASSPRVGPELALSEPARPPVAETGPKPVAPANPGRVPIRPAPRGVPDEMGALRQRVTELQVQVMQLSQLLTQQQALLSGSSRLMSFQLTPPHAGAGPNPGPLSPELQRALLLALARELGWLRVPGADGQSESADPLAAGGLGVDFIDLPPVDGTPARDNPAPSTNLLAQAGPSPDDTANTAGTNAPGSTIPGFVFGTNVVLVIPPTVVPRGSGFLTVWSGAATSNLQPSGTVPVSDNPTVVTFSTGPGGNHPAIFLTDGSSLGSSVIGQFIPPNVLPHQP